jgi:hypothetical protein
LFPFFVGGHLLASFEFAFLSMHHATFLIIMLRRNDAAVLHFLLEVHSTLQVVAVTHLPVGVS